VNNSTLTSLQQLIEIVARLRSSVDGCPWDLAQTAESLSPYVLEEAYEVVDAIRSQDSQGICEELGDLLLQVVLLAQVASDRQQFTLKEVSEGISQKLIRRHPHIFNPENNPIADAAEVARNWEKIKAEEKGEDPNQIPKLSTKLSKYLRSAPPLVAATKISEKAAANGFEWESLAQVWAKFDEELQEFQYALANESEARQESELGDLIFTLIQIARWQKLDPAAALQGTSQRFIQRLAAIEQVTEKPLAEYSLSELEILWQQAKEKLKNEEIPKASIPLSDTP
jgi:XTP/dITP diphosphohydrolase